MFLFLLALKYLKTKAFHLYKENRKITKVCLQKKISWYLSLQRQETLQEFLCVPKSPTARKNLIPGRIQISNGWAEDFPSYCGTRTPLSWDWPSFQSPQEWRAAMQWWCSWESWEMVRPNPKCTTWAVHCEEERDRDRETGKSSKNKNYCGGRKC